MKNSMADAVGAPRLFVLVSGAFLLGLTFMSALCVNFVLRDMTAQDVFGSSLDFDDA